MTTPPATASARIRLGDPDHAQLAAAIGGVNAPCPFCGRGPLDPAREYAPRARHAAAGVPLLAGTVVATCRACGERAAVDFEVRAVRGREDARLLNDVAEAAQSGGLMRWAVAHADDLGAVARAWRDCPDDRALRAVLVRAGHPTIATLMDEFAADIAGHEHAGSRLSACAHCAVLLRARVPAVTFADVVGWAQAADAADVAARAGATP